MGGVCSTDKKKVVPAEVQMPERPPQPREQAGSSPTVPEQPYSDNTADSFQTVAGILFGGGVIQR